MPAIRATVYLDKQLGGWVQRESDAFDLKPAEFIRHVLIEHIGINPNPSDRLKLRANTPQETPQTTNPFA